MKKIIIVSALFSVISSAPTLSLAAVMDEAVYFGAIRRADGNIEVKFIFSKASDGARNFSPTHGFSIVPGINKKQCGIHQTTDYRLSKEHLSAPLYDFADKTERLPNEKLPVFFAVIVSAELSRMGLVKTAEDSLIYHTCTRLLWNQLLDVPGKRP